MAKQMTDQTNPANQYQEKYADVGVRLARVDQIEDRLRAIEDDLRASGGRIPQAEAAERFVEVVRARRERVASQARAIASLTSENAPNLAAFAGSPVDLLDFLVLVLGDEIAEGGAAMLRAAEYEPGLPLTDRGAARARLADERASLVSEHLDLVASIVADGIGRDHLPENAQEIARRTSEAKAEVTRRANFEEAQRRLDGAVPQPIR